MYHIAGKFENREDVLIDTYLGSGSILIPLANPQKRGEKGMRALHWRWIRREDAFSYSNERVYSKR